MTNFPAHWRSIRLGGLFRRRDERGRGDLPLLSVYRDLGVVPREGREDNFNRPGEDLDAYRVVKPGDLVLNKMKTWQGSLGISTHKGIVSPAYFVAAQVNEAEPRFLHHLLRSRPLVAQYGARSEGIRPSQWDLPWDEFKDIRIALPLMKEQRAIADFLDRETARIDALIAKKQSLGRSLEERKASARDAWVAGLSSGHGEKPLRRSIQRIEQGWSPQCDSEPANQNEWGVLKTSAISRGTFEPLENKRLPKEIEPDLRWVVKSGDLLVTRGSGSIKHVGMAAVANTAGRMLMMSDLTYRVILREGHSNFVAEVLASSPCRRQVQATIRTDAGQTLKIRTEDIKELRIPDISPSYQQGALETFHMDISPMVSGLVKLQRQVDLLKEHRQALITAAVTGQVRVPASV